MGKLRAYTNTHDSGERAGTSITSSNPAVPLLGISSGLLHGDLLFAAVSLCATLSQVLPVVLVNVPFNRTTVLISLTVCFSTSIGIISIMLITVVFAFFHRQPSLPLQPCSLSATLYYLSESDILERFSHLAILDERARNKHIADMRLRYRFANIVGRDGVVKVGFQVV